MALLATYERHVDPVFQPADAAGDQITNDERTHVRVRNVSGDQQTVTVTATGRCNHGFVHDEAVTVDPGKDLLLGPFPSQRFSDNAGRASISYSDHTNLRVYAHRLGR